MAGNTLTIRDWTPFAEAFQVDGYKGIFCEWLMQVGLSGEFKDYQALCWWEYQTEVALDTMRGS